MKKIILVLFIISSQIYFSQDFTVPSFSLSQISTHIDISNYPDSLKSINLQLKFEDDSVVKSIPINAENSSIAIVFPNSGDYQLISESGKFIGEIRIIPGWLSIIPPLLAIILALLFKEVVTSLLAGIFIGSIFIFDFNPINGFLRMIDTIMMESLADPDHLMVIVFTLLFGAVIGIIAKNGGTIGISNKVVKFAKTPKSGLISSWMMGLFIFFDDYANTLIIGNMMRPITDKLRISREKLAYIVDSTAAPVASIVIISSWIGFEIGLIDAGLKAIGSTESAYDVFIQTIPYRFYPIGAIFLVFLTSYLNRDFGPMFRAEERARLKGILSLGKSSDEVLEKIDEKFEQKNARWYNGFIPIFVLLFGTIMGLYYTGTTKLLANGISDYSIRDIVVYSDSFSSLLWASFAATMIAIILSVSQKLLSLTKAINAMNSGLKSMLFACVILVLAWSISSVTNELHTADYLISILSDSINPRLLPVLVFLISGAISFSTGTSWGTMAIVMPIVIPLASKICGVSGFDYQNTIIIIHGVVSSVLAGSVFGDHCSPIADTTILSSIASKCNHMDHVRTQLPYAILVGVLGMVIGDIPTAYGLNPFISIVLMVAILLGILFIFGKKLPESGLTSES